MARLLHVLHMVWGSSVFRSVVVSVCWEQVSFVSVCWEQVSFVSVRLSAGNKSPSCLSVCLLGTSLLRVCPSVCWEQVSFAMADIWPSSLCHSHHYRRATKTGQTMLDQAKTVLTLSQFLSNILRARPKSKHVDFLGKANGRFQKCPDLCTPSFLLYAPSLSQTFPQG